MKQKDIEKRFKDWYNEDSDITPHDIFAWFYINRFQMVEDEREKKYNKVCDLAEAILSVLAED